MTITLNFSDKVEKKLGELAAASGCPDVPSYVRSLVEKKVEELAAPPALRQEFDELAKQWREETKYSSVAKRIAEHPAYRKIVAMGQTAIPLILADLEQKPDHWFHALREISGVNPVPEESRGKLREMADAWLKWGREQGYQW